MKNSLVDILKRDLAVCNEMEYCSYHKKKKNNLSVKLPGMYIKENEVSISPTKEVVEALKAIYARRQPAGSWNLVYEEREWLQKNVTEYCKNKTQVTIAVLGIAGTTHFIDTLSICTSPASSIHYKFIVIERCIRPLLDIEFLLESCGYTVSKSGKVATCIKENITVILRNGDICDEQAWMENKIDIVLLHYLLGFMTEKASDTMWGILRKHLIDYGVVLLAQDPTEFTGVEFISYFEKHGFLINEISPTLTIYRLETEKQNEIINGHTVKTKSNDVVISLRKNLRKIITQEE